MNRACSTCSASKQSFECKVECREAIKNCGKDAVNGVLIAGYCLIKRNYLGGKGRRKALKGLTKKLKNFNVLITEVERGNGNELIDKTNKPRLVV